MSEKHVLFISHDFPPAGGAGVQRSTKFVKYLPQFGWEPIVLTLDRPVLRSKDETLLNEIPLETVIIRTSTLELYPDSHALHRFLVSHFQTALSIPDSANLWLPYAFPAALREIRQRPVKAIYATGDPFASHILGALLKARTGLPLVLDYRDEWTLDRLRTMGQSQHRAWFQFLERVQQRWVVNKADKVLLVSNSARRAFSRAYGPSDKFAVVRNGYDADDFDAAVLPDLDCNKFHLAYTGSTADVDSRPETFLQGLRRALDNSPPLERNVQAHFVGDLDQDSKEIIVDLGLRPYVRATGYLSHRESVGYLRQVDVLLMIVRIFPNVVPGKVYEYMAAKKPVLALVCRDGETLELLKKSGTAFWSDPEDIEDIAGTIIHLENLWRCGALAVNPDESFIHTVTRRSQAEQLAQILDEISNQMNDVLRCELKR